MNLIQKSKRDLSTTGECTFCLWSQNFLIHKYDKGESFSHFNIKCSFIKLNLREDPKEHNFRTTYYEDLKVSIVTSIWISANLW